MKTIPEVLAHRCSLAPQQTALIETRHGKDRTITFSELNEQSHAFASILLSVGLKPGDPILVFVPVSIPLYISLLGIFRAGMTAVFLDPSSGIGHMARCCAMLPPSGFLGSPRANLLRWILPPLRKIPRAWWIGSGFAPRLPPGHSPTEPTIDPSQPALITFTSGSTGQPKAAVRSHAFLVEQHRALSEAISLEEGEVDLSTLPVFVLANLASGVTSLLPDTDLARPGQADAERVSRQLHRHRATRTAGSPAFYERLAQACEKRENFLSGFRKIYTGGAPVYPRLLQRLQTLCPHAGVVAVYGSTEAEPISEIDWKDISPEDLALSRSGRGLPAGRVVASLQLAILEDQWGTPIPAMTATEFAARRLPQGRPGEICVSGPHVLSGYLHGSGDEETKFRVDGSVWHRTGDAGWLDDQGRLWLLGRCSAKVRDGNKWLYPFSVECVAHTFPFIRRCAFTEHHRKRLLIAEYAHRPDETGIAALLEALAWARVEAVVEIPRMPMDRRHNAKLDHPRLRTWLDHHFKIR